MDVNRIFTPEQIVVHPELPQMLKEFTKAAIKENPQDITAWSVEYFRRKMEERPAVPGELSNAMPACDDGSDLTLSDVCIGGVLLVIATAQEEAAHAETEENKGKE